jgi:EAL domain-containing protein (putative c-di-GMP-specific phosphodiesterase class I)
VLRHEACVGLAERTGLSLPLGTWLMAQGCRRAPDWHPVPVSLGLTAHQSHDPDLVKGVLRVLAETGAPAGALRLGFPLRALMAEQGEAAENLRVLADVGVGTMVHDFAGGPMDLGYLEDLPAEGVRFSRRLVDLMPAGDGRFAAGAAVLDAVRTVRSAGLSVVVDGITSAEQAKWWRAAGADLALGAFYGPAGPAAGVDDLLARNRPARQLGVFRKSRDNSPT